jgi:hypothetical protein
MKISEFFYTQRQVAEILDVTPITIWRWSKMGRFDIQRIGKTILIPKWQIELVKEFRQRSRKKHRVSQQAHYYPCWNGVNQADSSSNLFQCAIISFRFRLYAICRDGLTKGV